MGREKEILLEKRVPKKLFSEDVAPSTRPITIDDFRILVTFDTPSSTPEPWLGSSVTRGNDWSTVNYAIDWDIKYNVYWLNSDDLIILTRIFQFLSNTHRILRSLLRPICRLCLPPPQLWKFLPHTHSGTWRAIGQYLHTQIPRNLLFCVSSFIIILIIIIRQCKLALIFRRHKVI